MKLGFIGLGNMASAMMKGIIKAGTVSADEVIVSNRSQGKCEKAKEEFGIHIAKDNKEVAKDARIVFLSVKPQMYELVINEIKDVVTEDQLIITIAPGKSLAWLEEKFGKKMKIVRTMPNTPAMVGAGMTAVCYNEYVTEEEKEEAMKLFESFGEAEEISEHLMDAVVCVSGSSPAYIFMMIEAMADGAVSAGMPRTQAYKFASQAVLGSAKMVLETGKHPGELKDMVCSPAGTTIEAVRVLEEKGLRSAVMEAMKVCEEKSRIM